MKMNAFDFEKMLAELTAKYKDEDMGAGEVEVLESFEEFETPDLLFECGYGRNYNDARYDTYNGYYND